jgi:hypothetical protein
LKTRTRRIDALESLIDIKGLASDRVQNVLGHPSPLLRFLTAQELAHRGKEAVMPVLIGLLDCTEQANSSCFVTLAINRPAALSKN